MSEDDSDESKATDPASARWSSAKPPRPPRTELGAQLRALLEQGDQRHGELRAEHGFDPMDWSEGPTDKAFWWRSVVLRRELALRGEALVGEVEPVPLDAARYFAWLQTYAAGPISFTPGADESAEELERADRLARFAQRSESPGDPVLQALIANAYESVTESQGCPPEVETRCETAVTAISARFDPPHGRVDEYLAMILRNRSVGDRTAAGRRAIVARVRALLSRYAEPRRVLDEQLASVLASLSGVLWVPGSYDEDDDEPSPDSLPDDLHRGITECVAPEVLAEIVEEIVALRQRWPDSEEMTSSLALALWRARDVVSVAKSPAELARQLRALSASCAEPDVGVDRYLALAVDACAVAERTPRAARHAVEELDQIAERYPVPDVEIDAHRAHGVARVASHVDTVEVWRDAVDKVETIAARHTEPDGELVPTGRTAHEAEARSEIRDWVGFCREWLERRSAPEPEAGSQS